jgi:toxin ParE1/3/4
MAHRLSPRAADDLGDIWFYVARESGSLEIANRLIDSLTDRFVLLANHPYAGRMRNDDLGVGRRSFPVGEYLIVYRIEDGDVLILRVVHGRRDLGALFGE